MKKVVIHKPGDHSVLKIEDFSLSDPKDSQVQVEVHFSGINYADICIRWGIYESAKKFVGWPITPGFEFSGVIKAVGKNSNFSVGDKVIGVSLFNAQSSHINIEDSQVFPLAPKLSLSQGSCFTTAYLTAYHALFQIVCLRDQSIVLVHSAAGGVGSALVQLLKAKGHTVIGVVGRSHKVESLKSLGCDYIIDKSNENLWAKVTEFAPDGLDVILDANGVETLGQGYRHLAPMGKLIVYGFHTMLPKSQKLNWPKLIWSYFKTPRFNPIDMTSANKTVTGFNLSFLFEHKDILLDAINDLFHLLDAGKISAHQITSFPYYEISKAHCLIESGQSTGKIAIDWTSLHCK